MRKKIKIKSNTIEEAENKWKYYMNDYQIVKPLYVSFWDNKFCFIIRKNK